MRGSCDLGWIRRGDHEMSRCLRCPDFGGEGVAREMSSGFCAIGIRCQDVKMSKMSKMSGVGPVTREMSGGFCVMFVRCQDV